MDIQEFKNNFIFDKNKDCSCMTIKNLKEIIESYPEDMMNFSIEDSWSWRGCYTDICFKITNNKTTKQQNLNELSIAAKTIYYGYKGGEYRYNSNTLVHFENNYDEMTNLKEDSFWLKFLNENEQDPFIKHLYNYFETDKYLQTKYYVDFLGNDITKMTKCIYWEEEGFNYGFVYDCNEGDEKIIICKKFETNSEIKDNDLISIDRNKIIQLL